MVLLRVFIHQAPCRFLLLNSCSLLKPSTPCRATLPEILTTEAGGRDVCVHGSRPKATRPLAPARHPTCRCRRTSSQDIFISGRRGTTAAASCQPSRNGLTDDERLFPHHTPVEERDYFHIIQHHLQGAKLPPSLTTAGSSRLLVIFAYQNSRFDTMVYLSNRIIWSWFGTMMSIHPTKKTVHELRSGNLFFSLGLPSLKH